MKQEYSGYESFKILYEEGIIIEGTIIQLNEGHQTDHDQYRITNEGDLESIADSDLRFKSEEVLSRDYSPNGWEIID